VIFNVTSAAVDDAPVSGREVLFGRDAAGGVRAWMLWRTEREDVGRLTADLAAKLGSMIDRAGPGHAATAWRLPDGVGVVLVHPGSMPSVSQLWSVVRRHTPAELLPVDGAP